MAVGYNASSIIGGPLDQDVLNQLQGRQELYKKETPREPKELLYLNSKTGWVKLSSSVNILAPGVNENSTESQKKGSSTLAKNNVLFGGSYKDGSTTPKGGIHGLGFDINRSDAAYQSYSSIGYRPMPGIDSFRIDSKNRFGTLREASVDFQVWSVEQLTEMESLYLRPGFTVLLEWGHSIYLKKKTEKDKAFISSTTPITVANYFTGTQDKEKVQEKINELKKSSNHNYDGIFGYIKNFSWSYRTDGGYDCKLTIISAGELIESVRVSLSTSQTGLKAQEAKDTYSGKSPLHVILTAMDSYAASSAPDLLTNETPEERKSKISKYYDNLQEFLKVNSATKGIYSEYLTEVETKSKVVIDQNKVPSTTEVAKKITALAFKLKGSNNEEDSSDSSAFSYIQFGDLLTLLNVLYLLKDENNNNIFSFSIDKMKSLFYTFPDHLALDPGVAVLSKTSTENTKLKYTISDWIFTDPLVDQETKENLTDKSILNIFLNVKYVLSVLDGVNDKNESERTVLAFVEGILSGLTRTMGNINDFGLHYEEDEAQYYIVDRKLTPNRNNLSKSLINLTGLKATVTNVSLSSRLSPNIASMIAISAQASGTDVDQDVESMFRWNRGLVDRIVGERNFVTIEQEDQVAKITDLVVTVSQQVSNFNRTFSYNSQVYDGLVNTHKQLMLYLSTRFNNTTQSAGAPGIIPFDLNITLDGIGGVKIGQAFRINKGILPAKYDDIVAFIITGVSHVVQSNKWNTELKAQTIIIGKGEELTEEETYDGVSDELLTELLEFRRVPPTPGVPFMIVDRAEDSGVPVSPDTFGKIYVGLSFEELLDNHINKDAKIRKAFSDLFYGIASNPEWQGYKIVLTASTRSYARSAELYATKDGGIPGTSAHNYGAGIDINIIQPDNVELKKASLNALWERTGVVEIAKSAGLIWGGGFKNVNPDPVHFAYGGYSYRETFKEYLNFRTKTSFEDVEAGLTTSINKTFNRNIDPLVYGANQTQPGFRFVPAGEVAQEDVFGDRTEEAVREGNFGGIL